MRIKETKLDDGRMQIQADADAGDVERAFDIALEHLARSLNVYPTPDKDLRECIKEKLAVKDVDSMVEAQARDALVPFALDKASFFPQSEASSSFSGKLVRGKRCSFTVLALAKPIYALSSYDPIEIEFAPFSFDDSELDVRMQQFVSDYPEFKSIDPHSLKKGDTALIALKVMLDGEEIRALTTDARPYVCGEGYMPGDFDEHVIGMEVGQTRNFEFEAPDWQGSSAGKMRTFEATITIQELQERVDPELSDEWVARNTPLYTTVAELREAVSENLEAQQRQEYDLALSSAVQEKLAERFVGEIPNEAYQTTAKSITTSLRNQLKAQNIDFDDFVKEQGGEQSFNMGLMMTARDTLRRDYALDAVFDHEGLSFSDKDIDEACMQISPNQPRFVREQMQREGRGFALREVATRIAAERWVVEHAIVHEKKKN